MSNPFLFDDDDGGDVANDPASNPFLQASNTEAEEFEEPTENPFLAQASNPFAFDNNDDSEQLVEPAPITTQEPVRPVDTAMSFFGTTITEDDENDAQTFVEPTANAFADDSEAKKVPPSRPTPPQTTQDLIFSVTDQLDQTSSHLLDRIPVTRTPSPVSMRDLHTPSPTPECADLLMSDVLESNANESVNPFADVDGPVDLMENVQQKVPARPTPPRPTPPRRPSPPTQSIPAQNTEENIHQQNADADLFDMFGTSAPSQPPQPKSNQQIMSLFSTPKEAVEQKPDLLTSDIFAMEPIKIETNIVQNAAPAKPKPPAPPQRPARPAAPPQVIEKVVSPPIETNTQIPSENVADGVSDIESATPNENVAISSIKINDEPYNSVSEDVGEKSDTISDNSSAVESSIRTPAGIVSPGVSTPFYTGGPDAQYLDRSQTPVSKEEMINSYINDVSPSAAPNPFGSPDNITPIPPKPVPPRPVFKQNDSFDAFAAKFDSVKKDTTDAFSSISSGFKSPAAADGK